jgi:hypothetical protein
MFSAFSDDEITHFFVTRQIQIFTRPKRGAIFAPTLSHIINKTGAVGSRVDGSDYPQTKNIVHAGPTICLGGTHVRDPHGFMRYSRETHIRWDTHILICGAHNSISNFAKNNFLGPPLTPFHENTLKF